MLIVSGALAISRAEGALTPAPPVNIPLQLPVMTTDFVRVTAPWIEFPIESPPMTCEVGKHFMLIQENDDFFIVMGSNAYQGVFLAAFPVNTREGRPAWTTPEQKVFFAYRTSSCRGKLYFKRGDELPVDAETRRDYRLRLERFDHAFPLYLSKTNSGFEFAKAPPPPSPAQIALARTAQKTTPAQKTSAASPQRTSPTSTPRLPPVKRYIVTPVGPSTNVFTISVLGQDPLTGVSEQNKEESFFGRLFSRSDKPAAAAEKPKEPDDIRSGTVKGPDTSAMKTQSVGKVTPAAVVTTTAVATTASPSTDAQAAAAMAGTRAKTSSLMSGLAKYRMPIIVMTALLLLIFGLFWDRLRKAQLRERAMEATAEALDADADKSGKPPPLPGTPNDFSGSIASMSLGSVTQFLNSDKETGTLHVKDKSNAEIGTLVFIKGEIVDAKSPKKRGIDALYEVLRNKEGFFSFLREEPKNVEKTITLGTISVLLDAHRIMDEEFKPPVPTPPPISPAGPAAKASRQTAPKPVTKLKLHGNR